MSPGRSRAMRTTSSTVRAGKSAEHTSTFGKVASTASGVKALSES